MKPFEFLNTKMIFWVGFGFGFDSRPNRYGMCERYMVLPLIKIKMYTEPVGK